MCEVRFEQILFRVILRRGQLNPDSGVERFLCHLSLPDLGKGWRYYGPTASEIRACMSAGAARPVRPTRACSQQERVLGLCGQS